MLKSWYKKEIDAATGKEVKFTLFERLDRWWYNFWKFSRVRDRYYDIRNYLFRRYDLIRTGLNPTSWWDKDSLILHGMMNLLVDYVENEKCFEIVCWDEEPHKHAADEIRAIYAWWKDYPRRQKEIDHATHVWYSSRLEDAKQKEGQELKSVDSLNYFFNCPQAPRTKDLLDLSWKLEEKLLEEEQEMLIRLIKIRKFLWT